jgi:hypothetical protein
MQHHLRSSLLLLALYCFSCTSLFAQALSFEDILKLYRLDSVAARQFCTSKQFVLAKAGNTGATMRYQFKGADTSTRLEINYPNDSTSLNVQLNYWFRSAKDYNHFRKLLPKNGFRRQRAKQVAGSLPSYVERYINKNLQVELIHPGDEQPYWLFLHPVGNYTW